MEQLRSRISNIRFKEFVLGFTLLHLSIILIYLHLFNFVLPRFLTVRFFYLTDKSYTNPKLSLINVPALNYLLRSQIFVNDDGQLRAVHLILEFEPISRSFLDVDNSIRVDDYRLARIDVSWPGFFAPYDLLPVDHPIPQGIPFAAEPLQQLPLGEAIIGEGTASSSSLEQEIDRFKFEEEETILISEAEEGADEHSCMQTPAQVVTFIADTSNEEETMAPKTGPSLRELMKSRNKAPSPDRKSVV